MQDNTVLLKYPSLTATTAVVNSNLDFVNDYWVYSSNVNNKLTDENTVTDFLNEPKNVNLATSFLEYLKNSVSTEEYQDIIYDNYKLSNVLNDYYTSTIINNSTPSSEVLKEQLKNTAEITYKDLNFDENGNRLNTYKTKLIDISTEGSFYITVKLNSDYNLIAPIDFEKYVSSNPNNIKLTDVLAGKSFYITTELKNNYELYNSKNTFIPFDEYLKKMEESNTVYIQGFVDLNQNDQAFPLPDMIAMKMPDSTKIPETIPGTQTQ
jgi:hypothetical protein